MQLVRRLLMPALTAWGLFTLTSVAAKAEPRVALVLTQSRYEAPTLADVRGAYEEGAAITSALNHIGFDVMVRADLTRTGLTEALDEFRWRLERAGDRAIGFVYYTGHGVQHPRNSKSYLLGIKANLKTASDVVRYGVDLEQLSDELGAVPARAVILVFDACRNNPGFQDFKAAHKGLSRVSAKPNMLIAYSTALNNVAEEKAYAPTLAIELRRGGRLIEEAFLATQRIVARETGKKQTPWMDNQIYEEICLMGDCGTGTAASTSPEDSVWIEVTARVDPRARCKGYQDFILSFPSSEKVPIAKQVLGNSCAETADLPILVPPTTAQQQQALYEWRQDIQFTKDPRTIEDFLLRFPTGAHVKSAKRRLEQLERVRKNP